MPADSFEGAVAGIFARCERALSAQLDKVKTRTENLQAEDTSRLAFTLTETIEHAVDPAIEEALASYDEALSQPVTSNPRWEEAVRARIGVAVDAGVAQALALDQLPHPWKPLLRAEAPKLRDRLMNKTNDGLKVIHRKHGPHRRRKQARREWALRLALLVLGIVIGAMLRSLLAAV
jgi:hypothetical protein